ncbi:hypothetical protein CANCADRAFT_4036 [Tortispora caseinolytica NRRL Y-17796]|uniref:Phosphatidate cytidylyltransferase n=1 Tax=Tortispora caseinolytica NRRL Y-17796 TaxID=767744 RepID=A0A1E4TCB9_9ASCO|nr:hypothetical protein CANCADRAFT_4036 [Tortispora caseinolytica NRRL Y-17796]
MDEDEVVEAVATEKNSIVDGRNKAESAASNTVAETAERQKKKQNFIVRTIWTLVMIAGFFALMFAGHVWMIALVALIQTLTFREVVQIASEPSLDKQLPFTKALNWYYLATTVFFLNGESVLYYFQNIVFVDKYFVTFAVHHRFISYCLYLMGFVFFVMSLQKGHYRFQFTQFCITHMTLLLVVGQAYFVIRNILNGMYWFFLPASLVITNDIFAYLCGMAFGRTPLTQLSPKKTVEGFIGAWFFTVLIGIGLSEILSRYQYMICPVTDLSANAFSGLHCVPNTVFVDHTYAIPQYLRNLLHRETFVARPIQLHTIILATFASLIAPFGGFFASGLKRTFHIKDFGNTIPGHGGITDRMDCQFLMGFFAFMYYDTFISDRHLTASVLLQQAVKQLTAEQQLELLAGLSRYLVVSERIPDTAFSCIENFIPEHLRSWDYLR